MPIIPGPMPIMPPRPMCCIRPICCIMPGPIPDPKIIKTVWGGGYMFTPEVSRA